MKEITFEELIEEKFSYDITKDGKYRLSNLELKILLQQVREATIAEAANYCVSQDWIKTIDNLKRMPTDRIIDFEKPTDRIKLNKK